MTELFGAVAPVAVLLTVGLVFGLAPSFVLRMLVHAYLRGDPRRQELVAELYVVPRVQRPLWVAEQIEVALFEGLGQRLRVRAALRSARRRNQSARARRLRRLIVVVAGISVVVGLVVAAWVIRANKSVAFAIAIVAMMIASEVVLSGLALLRSSGEGSAPGRVRTRRQRRR